MFQINYRIVENEDELKKMTKEAYDEEWGNIEGLLEIRFNESSSGYMYDGEISPKMLAVGCFQDELLVSWFHHLLEAVVALREGEHITVCEMECPKMLEFQKRDEILEVREIEEMDDKKSKVHFYKKFKVQSMGRPIVQRGIPRRLVELKSGEAFTKEIEVCETDFIKTTILHHEFEQEVIKKAQQFVADVEEKFPHLVMSRTLIRLRESIHKAEQCIKHT